MKTKNLRREPERRENEPVEETITADEILNTEFGKQDEITNRDEEREVELVLEIALANEEIVNDQEVEPVRKIIAVANENT